MHVVVRCRRTEGRIATAGVKGEKKEEGHDASRGGNQNRGERVGQSVRNGTFVAGKFANQATFFTHNQHPPSKLARVRTEVQ